MRSVRVPRRISQSIGSRVECCWWVGGISFSFPSLISPFLVPVLLPSISRDPSLPSPIPYLHPSSCHRIRTMIHVPRRSTSRFSEMGIGVYHEPICLGWWLGVRERVEEGSVDTGDGGGGGGGGGWNRRKGKGKRATGGPPPPDREGGMNIDDVMFQINQIFYRRTRRWTTEGGERRKEKMGR